MPANRGTGTTNAVSLAAAVDEVDNKSLDGSIDDLAAEYDNLRAVDDDDDSAPMTTPIDNADNSHAGHHVKLSAMCVMDCHKKERIIPNTDPPFVLENECFKGQVMLLVRTPDADQALKHTPPEMNATARRISEYFRGKKRRFEFQFQIKLKKIPTGPLFLGCELEHAIKVGTITKGLVGILLAMVRRINPGFHYSWGPSEGVTGKLDAKLLASGEYEKTHLSFPVEASMDRIIVTKPGEAPPALGYELFESNESVKRRRRMGAGAVDWNLEDTYTMCLWSAYCDWIKWKSLNVPGVSPFLLSRVTGQQPIYLSVYEITSTTPEEYRRKRPPHNRCDMNVYTCLEFSHEEKTSGGLAEHVVPGRRNILSSEQSLPDTESVSSDFETASRTSRVTML